MDALAMLAKLRLPVPGTVGDVPALLEKVRCRYFSTHTAPEWTGSWNLVDWHLEFSGLAPGIKIGTGLEFTWGRQSFVETVKECIEKNAQRTYVPSN